MDTHVERLELDQLNTERAVLRNEAGTELRLSRARWEEMGRPDPLVIQVLEHPLEQVA